VHREALHHEKGDDSGNAQGGVIPNGDQGVVGKRDIRPSDRLRGLIGTRAGEMRVVVTLTGKQIEAGKAGPAIRQRYLLKELVSVLALVEAVFAENGDQPGVSVALQP
jgi:hypothetical protein